MLQMMNSNNDYIIKIQNSGGYIAEFYVTYTVNGTSYNLDSGAFSLGFAGHLNVPSNADSIYLKVEIWIFGGLRVLFDNSLYPLRNYCFNLTGTIFNAEIIDTGCDSLGSAPTLVNNYVKIRNMANYCSQAYLTYYINGKLYTIHNKIIAYGQFSRINIPNTATNVSLKIYGKYCCCCKIIFNTNINTSQSYCFVLSGTIQSPICTNENCDR